MAAFETANFCGNRASRIVPAQRIPRIAWWKALPTEEHNVRRASLSEPAGASQAEPAQATGDNVGARGAQRETTKVDRGARQDSEEM
jgi:hypothetical protein